MSVMERRLQLLLDNGRFERVSAEARRSGRSVASVIREAIDLGFPAGDDERVRALDEFLALTSMADTAVQSWPEIKDEMAEVLREDLPE